MNEQTMELLKECTSGCTMAVGSINQIMQYVKDDKLSDLLIAYKGKHEKFHKEAALLLDEAGKDEKNPSTIDTVMARFGTEMKLMIKSDNHQIAKLMMDGCNMGIQSICKSINEHPNADKAAVKIAKDIVSVEEDFVKEMEKFM